MLLELVLARLAEPAHGHGCSALGHCRCGGRRCPGASLSLAPFQFGASQDRLHVSCPFEFGAIDLSMHLLVHSACHRRAWAQ